MYVVVQKVYQISSSTLQKSFWCINRSVNRTFKCITISNIFSFFHSSFGITFLFSIKLNFIFVQLFFIENLSLLLVLMTWNHVSLFQQSMLLTAFFILENFSKSVPNIIWKKFNSLSSYSIGIRTVSSFFNVDLTGFHLYFISSWSSCPMSQVIFFCKI